MTINTLLGSTSVELKTTVVRYILYKVIYSINSILNNYVVFTSRNECAGNNMNRQVTRILIIRLYWTLLVRSTHKENYCYL